MSEHEIGRENEEVAQGFAPIARRDAHVLVLGSLPSRASLQARQYYAQGSYSARCRSLQEHGIAVWDVLSSSLRPGSLDADIDMASAVPNDFEQFFARHRDIRLVCFNGRKAQQMFDRYVRSSCPDDQFRFALLPSTSPAHASLTLGEKLEVWRGIIEPALGKGQE
jgi:hypoxanthine-DNA glycosylase